MKMKGVVTHKDPTRIDAEVGSIFEIELDVISSAGYEWIIEHIPDVLHPEGVRFKVPRDTIGGAARQCLRFRARSIGKGILSLQLKRPWEVSAEQTKDVAVVVAKGAR